MITKRYEKGMKFLDLETYTARGIDEDGVAVYDQCWECVIYENGANPDEHTVVEFGNEVLAQMFIVQNGWTEQVL